MDAYLNSIKKKYATTNGGDEIINDIELRIAELLIEQVGLNGAVMMQHVESIITTMGRPEEFEADTMTDENLIMQRREQNIFIEMLIIVFWVVCVPELQHTLM